MPAHHLPHVAVWIETSRGYGRGLIRGVARYVRQHGPWSIHFTPHGLREPFRDWLAAWRGDGILARIDDRAMARAFRARRRPLIDLRGRVPGLRLPIVGLDNRPVAELALEHLRQRGLRNFGFFGTPLGQHIHLDQRREYFCEAVGRAGHACHVYEFAARRNRRNGSGEEQSQISHWLRSLPRPIGVMCCNDDRGQQLLDACRRAGLLVPDEVAVLGVDNDEELCNLATPSLSSIEVGAERIGFRAAALLDDMMAGRAHTATREILFAPTHVVTRLSTDTVAVDNPALARALRLIRDRACGALNVVAVARAAAMSRRYLEREMQAALGRTPHQEIARVRLERARQLLLETDLPLEAISRQSGFRTAKYFGDAFRQATGVPPGTFRQQARQAGGEP